MDPNETKIYSAFLIAAVILGIFFIFFIITILRHQRKNTALYKEKILVEINTLETERSRIASDLHDDLGPTLSTVKLLVNNISISGSEDQKTLDRANHHIDSILQRVRTISNNLMPQALIRKGLQTAVREFAGEINEKGRMQVRFSSEENLKVAGETEIHLYRIVQEIINNAIKHSGALECTIQMKNINNGVQLVVRDNGCGFDKADIAITSKGLGLHNIMSRVETLKGKVYLESERDKGTIYTIEIPGI